MVTISAITPLPGDGSSPILRPASAPRPALSVYSLTHAAVETPTFNRAYDLCPVILRLPVALTARLPVVP